MGRTRIVTETEESDSTDDQVYAEHPLFPLEEGDKSFETSYIQITRIEEGAQKFGPVVAATDLLTEQQITERWGGGQYVIIARAASKLDGIPGRFRKHRRVTLPGNPKPLSPDPTPNEQKLAAPQTSGAAQASPMGGDSNSFFAMMMQMQQQALERERQASERAAQQSQQFMQMFMSIMTGSKNDSASMMQVMMQMSAQSQQSMLQFITATMSNRGGGPEEMAKYAELLRQLGVGGAKPAGESGGSTESIGSMLENAADVIQGMVALKGGASPAAPTQVDASAVPTGGGGAASVLRGMMGR
jgi:hypothetical protein